MANKICDNACILALLPMETWEESLTTINETLRNEYRPFIEGYKRIVTDPRDLKHYPQWRELPTLQLPHFSKVKPEMIEFTFLFTSKPQNVYRVNCDEKSQVGYMSDIRLVKKL